MSNAVRGTVTFEASGETWTLKFSTNALCELEDALGASADKLGEMMADSTAGRMKMLRTVLKCALSDHHPDLSSADVGNLIDEIGFQAATTKMQQALVSAFPQGQAKGGAGNPPKGATAKRTGRRS